MTRQDHEVRHTRHVPRGEALWFLLLIVGIGFLSFVALYLFAPQ
jgi:hypothetical protein